MILDDVRIMLKRLRVLYQRGRKYRNERIDRNTLVNITTMAYKNRLRTMFRSSMVVIVKHYAEFNYVCEDCKLTHYLQHCLLHANSSRKSNMSMSKSEKKINQCSLFLYHDENGVFASKVSFFRLI
jgi:hypothetical protein